MPTQIPTSDRTAWFNQARYGIFIHFGLYSVHGRGEWAMFQEGISQVDYEPLADQFQPDRFNARDLANLARDSGAKYMVMGAKHHDGFCLFDTATTEFNSVRRAARRDLIAEYVQACRAAGLKVGIYLSVKDWRFPAYFKGPEADPAGWAEMVDCFHAQAMELMSNYGTIDILWYDCADDANFRGGWGDKAPAVWRSAELYAKVLAKQAHILINNRSGLTGDFTTPEQYIPNPGHEDTRVYESCMTMNDSWAYRPTDNRWKPSGMILDHLVACACRGCNYLLNVGPTPEGVVPPESVERLRLLGDWLRVNGEAIYGTQRVLACYWDYTSCGRISCKGSDAYLILDKWPVEGEHVLTSLANEVRSASLLATGQRLAVRREGRRVLITGLPTVSPSAYSGVIKLELDGPARAQFHY